MCYFQNYNLKSSERLANVCLLLANKYVENYLITTINSHKNNIKSYIYKKLIQCIDKNL